MLTNATLVHFFPAAGPLFRFRAGARAAATAIKAEVAAAYARPGTFDPPSTTVTVLDADWSAAVPAVGSTTPPDPLAGDSIRVTFDGSKVTQDLVISSVEHTPHVDPIRAHRRVHGILTTLAF